MIYSRSKLAKYRHLADSPQLQQTLPETYSFTKKHFWIIMVKYGEAIVKPSGGWGGQGVLLVTTLGGDEYQIHNGNRKKVVRGRDNVYSYLARLTGKRKHIVQRKIKLATVGGRPFDIRVMIQRKKGKSWTVTGKLAKIAGPGFIVTNVERSRGRVMPLTSAIRSSNIQGRTAEQLEREMDEISLAAAKKLQQYYKIDTIGLDVGLDAYGKIWIIEPNFTPSIGLFLKLKDKSMFRKIKSFQDVIRRRK